MQFDFPNTRISEVLSVQHCSRDEDDYRKLDMKEKT